MVLDGAVDPKQGEVAAAETQAAGFEHAFNEFAADCKARNAACLIGPDPRAAVTRLLAKARVAPIPGGSGGRNATAGHVVLAVISALYDRGEWAELESALADAANGNSSGMFALADRYDERDGKGHYTNLTDANISVNCADSAEKVPDATVRKSLAAWRTKYPLFGTTLALGDAHLPAVGRAPRAAAGGPGRRGPAAAGHRHGQRPGHAVRVGAGAGPDPGHRPAADLARGGAHGVPRRRRACRPRWTRTCRSGPGPQRDLRRILIGLRQGCRPGSGLASGRR